MLIGISAHPTTVVEIATGFALAMTRGRGLDRLFYCVVIQAGRRRQCRTPYGVNAHRTRRNAGDGVPYGFRLTPFSFPYTIWKYYRHNYPLY